MRNSWVLALIVTCCTIKADDSIQASTEIREVFCTDGAAVFYVSPEKEVTSPSDKARLRILEFQDGKLLLTMEQQLVYPVVPNLTPVFLSEENKLIMLPDLAIKGAAIGLRLPEGQHTVVHDILHHPTPPQHVVQVLSRAESIAAGLVQRAEAMGRMIGKKSASLRTGPPAAPSTHTLLKASAHYTRVATDKVVGAMTWATNLIEQATEKVGQVIRPVMPRLNQQKGMGTVSKPEKNSAINQAQKIANELTSVSMEALDKIREALQKSAEIIATSVRENTVKVVQHKFGEDMGEAMGDVFESVKNTVMAADQLTDLRNLKLETIAQNAVRRAIKAQAQRKDPQYTCKEDL